MKIAVVSGKGGSGKSSISAAFIALAGRVVAADCDVDATNLPLVCPSETVAEEPFVSGTRLTVDRTACISCGRCVEECAFGALELEKGTLVPNPFLCEGCGLCVRLCPSHALKLEEEAGSRICTGRFSQGILIYGRLRPGDDNSGKMIARIRDLADNRMEEEGISLQILDGPPGIGCPVLSTLTGMDRVVLVCEPSLSGLSDLERIHQVASAFCNHISVIINKSDIYGRGRDEIAAWCRDMGVPVIAELPFDPSMVNAQLQGKSVIAYAPDSVPARRLAEAFRELLRS